MPPSICIDIVDAATGLQGCLVNDFPSKAEPLVNGTLFHVVDVADRLVSTIAPKSSSPLDWDPDCSVAMVMNVEVANERIRMKFCMTQIRIEKFV